MPAESSADDGAGRFGAFRAWSWVWQRLVASYRRHDPDAAAWAAYAGERFVAFQTQAPVWQELATFHEQQDSDAAYQVIVAIGQRPDSVEKMRRFQALELLFRRIALSEAEYKNRPRIISRANLWAQAAQLGSKGVWERLQESPRDLPRPSIEELVRAAERRKAAEGIYELVSPFAFELVTDLTSDREVMGILGLKSSMPSNVKKISPNLDLKATDKDLDL